jgi:hypothetical protein
MKRNYKMYLNSFCVALALTTSASIANAQTVLYDNGPLFNNTGTGAGGANESMLYTTTFGMGTIGFGAQQTSFNRVADDFTVADCQWRVDSIVFFCYQTGSTTTSTITGVNFRIWDSIPEDGASTLVYGDTTTNAMIRTEWSGVYRITETTVGNSTRPIMRNVCTASGLILTAGNYWMDWSYAGTLGSGPWAPPIVITNTAITGNGKQKVSGVWNNLVDGGTGTPAQGLPFIIYGTKIQVVADAGSDIGYCDEQSFQLGGAPTGSGGLGTLTYSWLPVTNLDDATIANPTLTVFNAETYVLTIVDSIGCVDTDTIEVTINTMPDLTVTALNETLTATQSGATYQWIDCNTNTAIGGEMAQSYVATASGDYAVIVTLNNCSDTSSCTNVVVTGIDELNNASFSIYPNPSNGVVTIKAATTGFYTITNEIGQTVQSFNLNASNNYKLTLDKLNSGIYFVVGVSNNKTTQQKIIVTQ